MALKAFTLELAGVIPIAGTLIDNFDSLWSAVFLARLLGGLYALNRDKLNWV